jgi:predicted amidohydrolase
MLIASAQTPITSDVRQNGEHIRAAMEQAAAAKARLVHFAEGALSGYVKSQVQSWQDVDWAAVSEELAEIMNLAAKLGVWVVVGCNHRLAEPAWPQNSLYVISDQGTVVARYSKRFCSHAEVTAWYTPGSDPVTFEVDGIRFGCALCIEVCFPELFAEYETLKVDCVLLSAYSTDPVHRLMARAHAATNCFWVSVAVPAQCSGNLPGMVIGPNGSVISEGMPGSIDLVLSPLDGSAAQFEIALRYARPWRAKARKLEIYQHRR